MAVLVMGAMPGIILKLRKLLKEEYLTLELEGA